MELHPLLILVLGTAIVIGGIVGLRISAFFSLLIAAFVVSFLAPGDAAEKVARVVEALGSTAGKIGVVIACAAVIGKCMTDSGAADRIVRGFLSLLGEKRAPAALMSSGFVLAVPVFFDTVFYLLVPLARSLFRRTGKKYLLYILAIGAGGAITHTLVPPTPGPLAMAENLGFDVGMMIMMGLVVALPSAIAALAYAHWIQGRMDVPMRPLAGEEVEDDEVSPGEDERMPGLFASCLPILLPILLISANTIVSTMAVAADGDSWVKPAQKATSIFGDANFALLLSAAIALIVYVRTKRPGRDVIGRNIEAALMSSGVIILITSAGGAFGAMLKAAQVGPMIQGMFAGGGGGLTMLFIGWVIASLLKISQGSSTVAMITTSSMLAAMITAESPLPFHPVYLALAIGCGSLCISWMNDSGFWIVSRMSGLTETEALKTWTVTLVVLSVVGLIFTVVLASVLPMAG